MKSDIIFMLFYGINLYLIDYLAVYKSKHTQRGIHLKERICRIISPKNNLITLIPFLKLKVRNTNLSLVRKETN